MSYVDNITYIKGTDREFVLRAVFEESKNPKDLSSFVGATGNGLSLNLLGENGTVTLTLDQTTEGILEVESAADGVAGKVKVTISDTSTLKAGKNQNMELVIREADVNDSNSVKVSCVQYEKSLEVKNKLF